MNKIYFNYKLIAFLILAVLQSACQSTGHEPENPPKESRQSFNAFGKLLDSLDLTGSILIWNSKSDTYYSNDYALAESGFLPASTFKIPNTIIGLETGAIEEFTIFKWDSLPRRLPIWERDHSLMEAFRNSCVPCYQEIARSIGIDSMNHYLSKLDFGKMDVNPDNIDLFWLEGNSQISPFQQIEFLRKMYEGELPIAPKTREVLLNIMEFEQFYAFKLYGKTGWASRQGHNTGWFVGFVIQDDNVYYFATCIEPRDHFDMSNFTGIRMEISLKGLEMLGFIER